MPGLLNFLFLNLIESSASMPILDVKTETFHLFDIDSHVKKDDSGREPNS
jgi:hypothetical protein